MPRCEEGIVIEKEDATPRLFLDSGAPSLYNRLSRITKDDNKKGHRMGSTLEARKFDDFTYTESPAFKEYLEKYIKFVHEYKDLLDVYVTVDVINNPEKTWEIQKYLESNGLRPLPVWHYGSDTKWLERYIDEYDYIGIGGMVPLKENILIPGLDVVWDKFLTNRLGKPVIKVHGLAATAINLMFRYPWFCMTDSHKILTKEGWKGMETIQIGDQVLTYVSEGKSTWKPVQKIHQYDVNNITIRKYSGPFNAEVTLNHKWPVYSLKNVEDSPELNFIETRELDSTSLIPCKASYLDFPTKKKYSNELIKLICWVVTNGSVIFSDKMKEKGRTLPSISIHMCRIRYPEHVKEIKRLLSSSDLCYSWNESVKIDKTGTSEIVTFFISGELKTEIYNVIGIEKKIPFDFVLSLTKYQNQVFIEEILKGYGIPLVSFIEHLPFKWKRNAPVESLKLAFILAGYSLTDTNKTSLGTSFSFKKKRILPSQSQFEDVNYTGKIWCIEVENHTFFTKCNGSYYWTGNSVDSTSWIVYAMYGIILIPKFNSNGERDFTKIPLKVSISEKSTAQFDGSRIYYFHMSGFFKKMVDDYIFDIGKTIFPEATFEEILKNLSSSHPGREQFNAMYYIQLEQKKRTSPFKKLLRRQFLLDD